MIDADGTAGLVGRARVLEGVVAALDDTGGFGAVIVGGAGIGKTALARAVVDQLRWSSPVLKVTGGSSLRNIPFGALAPYLHTLSVADSESPVAILRAVMGHLTTGGNGLPHQSPLLVVDDAHELDDSSSALLAQLVNARRAKVLVLIRDMRSAPRDIADLSADRLLARFELRPLDDEAVARLCAQILEGPVLTGTVHALARVTGGNPMFLRTLLDHGVDEGYLTAPTGVWRLTDDQPIVDLRLLDLIRSQLRMRQPEDMEALETIALAEPIALDVLSRCVGPGALQRLREDHLVAVGPGPHHPVVLEQPLYGDAIRSQIPAARSMMIRRRVLAVTGPGTQSLEGFVRTVSWGLDCGVQPDGKALIKAAVVANGLRDHGSALRAARAVSEPALKARALTELARVQAGRNNLASAQELVDEALRHCTDLGVAKDATLLAYEVNVRAGASYEDLRDVIEHWLSLIRVMKAREGAHATPVAVERSLLGCRILECHVLILEGRYAGVEEELRSVLDARHATPETRLGALILLSELLGSTGRSVEAAESSGEALAIIDGEGAHLIGYRELAVARHVFVLTSSGRSAEAKAVLREHSRAHRRSIVYFAGWGDVVDGVSALRSGRNREARDRFLLALEALQQSDVTQVATLLLGLAAYACALAGDAAQAADLTEQFDRTPERGSRTMRLGGQIFVTAAAALLGDAPGAREGLIGLAATAEKDRMRELAATALTLALLLGDTSAVAPLISVLDGLEGQGVGDVLDFAIASRDGDPEGMVGAATAAGENGSTSFEYAGLTLALQMLESRGSSRQARSIHRRLVALDESRQGTHPGRPAPASPTAHLTPTERKIVALVKVGYSNREIAEDRGVSVRTVEGHLYRIFAKLGVARREDLRDP